MIKYKSKDFTLIECSYSNNEELSKDEPSPFWEFYKEQDSCILFQAKEVGEIGEKIVIKRDGTVIDIPKEDITKGKILKLFGKNLLVEIKDINQFNINNDKEDEWSLLILNKDKSSYCVVHFIRTNYKIDLEHDGKVFLRIPLEENSVENYLGFIYSYLSHEEIRELFKYSKIIIKNKNDIIITIDNDWEEILRKAYINTKNDEKYKKLINNL